MIGYTVSNLLVWVKLFIVTTNDILNGKFNFHISVRRLLLKELFCDYAFEIRQNFDAKLGLVKIITINSTRLSRGVSRPSSTSVCTYLLLLIRVVNMYICKILPYVCTYLCSMYVFELFELTNGNLRNCIA